MQKLQSDKKQGYTPGVQGQEIPPFIYSFYKNRYVDLKKITLPLCEELVAVDC